MILLIKQEMAIQLIQYFIIQKSGVDLVLHTECRNKVSKRHFFKQVAFVANKFVAKGICSKQSKQQYLSLLQTYIKFVIQV